MQTQTSYMIPGASQIFQSTEIFFRATFPVSSKHDTKCLNINHWQKFWSYTLVVFLLFVFFFNLPADKLKKLIPALMSFNPHPFQLLKNGNDTDQSCFLLFFLIFIRTPCTINILHFFGIPVSWNFSTPLLMPGFRMLIQYYHNFLQKNQWPCWDKTFKFLQ